MGTRYLAPPNTKHKPTIKKIQYFFHSLTKLNNFYVIGNISGWLQIFFESQKQRSKRAKEKTQEEEEKKDNWYFVSKVLKKNFHGEWHQKRFLNKTGKILLWKKKNLWLHDPKHQKKIKKLYDDVTKLNKSDYFTILRQF